MRDAPVSENKCNLVQGELVMTTDVKALDIWVSVGDETVDIFLRTFVTEGVRFSLLSLLIKTTHELEDVRCRMFVEADWTFEGFFHIKINAKSHLKDFIHKNLRLAFDSGAFFHCRRVQTVQNVTVNLTRQNPIKLVNDSITWQRKSFRNGNYQRII
jgi:hypothetical protein